MTCCGVQRSSWSTGNISHLSIWMVMLGNIVGGVEIESCAFAYVEIEGSVENSSEDVSLHLDI